MNEPSLHLLATTQIQRSPALSVQVNRSPPESPTKVIGKRSEDGKLRAFVPKSVEFGTAKKGSEKGGSAMICCSERDLPRLPVKAEDLINFGAAAHV